MGFCKNLEHFRGTYTYKFWHSFQEGPIPPLVTTPLLIPIPLRKKGYRIFMKLLQYHHHLL